MRYLLQRSSLIHLRTPQRSIDLPNLLDHCLEQPIAGIITAVVGRSTADQHSVIDDKS